MEALLPSEISRLILGYLDEQSCTVAYQTFLETCPHLKECAEAARQGIRFSTRAAGRSLRDILNEYCLIYTIVQDRILKLPESTASQLKTYGISLADQVKHLIDGKQTGQRFHVNITVPTQPKNSKPRLVCPGGMHTPGSSHHMVTPTSSRMRRSSHPIQEQRLTLRSQDPKEDVTASVTVQRVETTQLENLPGSPVSTPSSIGHSVRKVIHSESRNHLNSSESAPYDQEEENSSLLDPKTGELSSPPTRQSSDLSESLRSMVSEANPHSSLEYKPVVSNSSVPSTLSPRQSEVLSDSSRTAVGNQSSSGIPSTQNESGCGRSSLDKFLINILSSEVSNNVMFHEKSVSSVSCSSQAVTRTDGSFVVPQSASNLKEQSANQCVEPAAGTSTQDQEGNTSSVFTSPNQKKAPKSVNETYATTPRRSATKRKTKPTPLKMTPLKNKAVSDSSESADVIIDPKLFYGPLLDNRELHERIAENINQFIRPSGLEEGFEPREMNTAETVSDALASTSTEGKGQPNKDLTTQEELERVIKTVVDKTESDPLFESLLCDILGPECEDESVINSLVEGKSTQGGTSQENGSNDSRPSEDGKKDPIALLEDQNEAAIKSILEAQPMMKDSPNHKQGKTALKRKGKRVPHDSSTKVVQGIPSGACSHNFAETEISRKNIGQEAEGVGAAVSNENIQANGQDGNKLVILPFQDIVVPPLAYPTIIFSGVPQRMVPPSQSKMKLVPIIPKEPLNIIPGNPPFILRKMTTEEVKHINIINSSPAGMITDSSISFSSAANETTVNTVIVQGGMPFSDHEVTSVQSVNVIGHVESLQPVVCSGSDVSVDVNMSNVPLGTESAADKIVADENRTEAVAIGSSCAQGSTPDVVSARPTRSATEGQQKNLEKQGDTPMMPAGKRRVSMSTPRRKSRGHIRALDFGSTPPKQLSTTDNSSNKVLSTSTPYGNAPGKFGVISSLRPPLPSSMGMKELSKCLGVSRGSQLPDLSTMCIATRSPPPRLSGAWNKVGVDLIFGCDNSPNTDPVSPISQGSRESLLQMTKEHHEGSKDGAKGSLNQESPKSKNKIAWDAALRAQLGNTPEAPTMTRIQMRAILREEKQKQRAEAQLAAEIAKKKKLQQNEINRSLKAKGKAGNKSRCLEVNSKPLAKGKSRKKSLEEKTLVQEKHNSNVNEHPSVVQDARKNVEEKEEEVNSVTKSNLNEDEGAGDQLTIGEKRKRSSRGEAPIKKKIATEARPAHELDSPHVGNATSGETTTSPEKTWVVQQSPGSWANKRSLHGITPGQKLDSEGNKSGNSAARRCLDLHETPRKPEISDISERMTQSGTLISKLSTAGDCATLTVVDTPLFPPTPGISGIGTPCSLDSGEAVETFPTYFKPREKDGSAAKGKQVEVTSGENVDFGAPSQNSLMGSSVDKVIGERESSSATEGAEKSDIVAHKKVGSETMEDGGIVEVTVPNMKKKGKSRKPPIRKTPTTKVQSKNKTKKGKSKVEEEESDTDDEEVLPTRVLRPRRKTSYFPEGQMGEEAKKDDLGNKETKGSGKKKAAPRKKKKVQSPDYVSEPCEIVPEEEIEESLVFKPLPPEVVQTQSQEAEVLAKQIKLKLSPLVYKTPDSEEEEDDEGESALNVSGPTGKVYKQVDELVVRDSDPENSPLKGTDSSVSSRSSSSESSSSDSSPEDEADHDEAAPAGDGAGSSCDAVGKKNECIRQDDADKGPLEKVTESGSMVDGNQPEKGEAVKPQCSTSKSENIENSDGKKLKPMQWKKGNGKEVTGSSGGRLESEKLGQSEKLNILEKKDLSKEMTFLSDQKKRRDNLEKILFGRECNDSEEVTRSVETEGTRLPFTDHSISTELELKKQRTMERLKGRKSDQSSGSSEIAGPISLQNPQPARSSLPCPTVKKLSSPQKRLGNLLTQRSPRKSTPVKESAKMISIFDGEEEDFPDECPELRLSEGDEFEFGTPDKILISPGKFELLASLEDKLAVLHGDITSPVIKKTARMSCTSTALRSVESSPRKELLKQLCSDANTIDRTPDISSKEIGKECVQEQEAIPSTSKAAELRHKENERKYLLMMQGLPSPSRASGVTMRKNCSEKLKSLRSHQPEGADEDVLKSDKSVQSNKEPLLDDESQVIEDENCKKLAEGEGKNKCYRSSLKKSKEDGALQISTGQNVPASVKTNQKDISKDGERIGDALESQNEVENVTPGDKESTEKEITSGAPLSCVCPPVNDEGTTKQGKKQQNKNVEGVTEVERSKDKLSHSRKKGGHVQNSNSKDGKSWLLNEDELTRDGFTTNASNERGHGNPPIINYEVSCQKIPEASKNSVPTEKGEKQNIEMVKPVEHSEELKGKGHLPHKSSCCDTPLSTSPGQNSATNKGTSSPSKTTTQQIHENISTLDVEQVREQLLEGVRRQLNCTPKETSRKSSKNTSKPSQRKLTSSKEGDSQTRQEELTAEVGSSTLNVKEAEKSDCDQVHSDHDKGKVVLGHASEGQESCKKLRDLEVSPHRIPPIDTGEAPSTAGVLSDSCNDLNASVPTCSQVSEEEGANNVSWPGSTDMSFSSNEVYITIVYDEDNPPISTSSVLASQLGPPLSPSAPELEGLTVELDGEVVTITKSDYIELFTYTPKESTPQVSRGTRCKVISAILSTSKISKIDHEKQKVATKKKKDDDSEQKFASKGVLLSSDRKRRHTDGSEQGKGEILTKSSRPSRRKEKEVPKKSSSSTGTLTDKEMASIQRVVDACNDISNDENTVDDDSLMTFAAIGSISSEENHNKVDEGSRKFLPLKKRRTTTEDTPVKSQTDGDVVNSNSGMFLPLNAMEIEDFLSKVHGEGS